MPLAWLLSVIVVTTFVAFSLGCLCNARRHRPECPMCATWRKHRDNGKQ